MASRPLLTRSRYKPPGWREHIPVEDFFLPCFRNALLPHGLPQPVVQLHPQGLPFGTADGNS